MEVSEDGFLEELLLLGRESWEMPTTEMAAFFTAAATPSLSWGGGGVIRGGLGCDFDANCYVDSTITTTNSTSTILNSDILPIINSSYYDDQCFSSSATCSCCCSIINNHHHYNNNSAMFYPTSDSIDIVSNNNSSSSSETLIIKKLEQPNYPNFNLQHHEDDGYINEYNNKNNNNNNFPMMIISSDQNQNQNQNQIFQKQHSESEQQHCIRLSSDENGKGNGTRIMGGGIGSFCHTNTININNNSRGNSNSNINCSNINNNIKKKKVQSAGGHQSSKNLMAERRRRKRLNDRLSMLRSVVPKISKMDRTSILGDTIDYVKELLDRITNLKQEIHDIDQLNTSITIFNDDKPTIATAAAAAAATTTTHDHHTALLTYSYSNSNANSNSTPRFDVERRNVDTRVQMCCSGKPGLLLSTLTTLEEALGLQIQHCVISCFNDFSLTASCSEEAGQRTLVSSEEIKQALFRNAGYGGRCL